MTITTLTLTEDKTALIYPMRLRCPLDRAFDIEYWRSQNAITGSAEGRGTTWFVAHNGQQMALRHYWRGGVLGRLLKDNYLFLGTALSRPHQELRLLEILSNAGINVPAPVAAKIRRRGIWYQGDIITTKVDQAQDLVSYLSKHPICSDTWRSIGRTIRSMHDINVNHSDLNAKNILIDHNQACWLIDFDKCEQRKPGKWKTKNLDRLKRSLIKESNKQTLFWQEQDWQSLLLGYAPNQDPLP